MGSKAGQAGLVPRLAGVLAAVIVMVFSGCSRVPVRVREPAVAGAFYPADPAELRSMVEKFVDRAETKHVPGDLLAVIAPHAGYVYSGGVAGYAYRQLRDRPVDTVIILGPNHRAPLTGVSVYTEGVFRTPLGDAVIDGETAGRLLDPASDIVFAPEVHEKEHSIETQLPFLQVLFGENVKIVPVLVGMPTQKSFASFTERLADELAHHPKTLLVVSTDLSHYHDYDTARTMDHTMLEPIKSIALEEAEGLLRKRSGEMCGGWPVLYALKTARLLGANEGVLYAYANSGDTAGTKDRVVGYAAMGLYRRPLTKEDRRELHRIAAATIDLYVRKREKPDFSVNSPRLKAYGAAFVTINRHGHLRGCIGSTVPREALYRSVIDNALRAAVHDPRFAPVTPGELGDLEVEVSVLSPMKPLRRSQVGTIEIGRDGLFLVKGRHSGIFLPQVPVEQGWDRETYLKELCRKAGLPAGSWRADDARLYTFTADVIRGGDE